MIERTIKYTDFNGVQREEKFYFHLSKAELLEMETTVSGGFTKNLEKIIAAQDGGTIIQVFKDIVLRAYGEKSDDGRRFMKSPEIAKAFSETEAYTELFMELATDADAATAFVKGVLPNELQR